ncbi:MAG: hypothetical protein Q7K38_00390 [Candidatus Wildermuthbacteria bacterium]|nr:hypothetical protein [Candidatus Wildermuthbacteria bacterium]
MTTATAVQPATFKAAIEGFMRLLGPLPCFISVRDLQDAGKAFADLAQADLKLARKRMYEQDRFWGNGTFTLVDSVQIDEIVRHSRDSIEIGGLQVRMISWARNGWDVEKCTVTLASSAFALPERLVRLEWLETYEHDNPEIKARVAIEFSNDKVTACSWEGTKTFR